MKNIFIILAAFSFVSCTSQNSDKIKETTLKTTKKTETKKDTMSLKIVKTDAEWKALLTPEEYAVLREKGTERPYTGEYDKHFEKGMYVCAACENPLFTSDTKFDSHCGWPAFWRPSETDSVLLELDTSYGMRRIEVKCKACLSHLGHVFEGEGFGYPTDQRYCINRITLIRHP